MPLLSTIQSTRAFQSLHNAFHQPPPFAMPCERKASKSLNGKTDVPEYPVKGKDEMASLGRSFNLMHRSLENAIRMLEGST